MRAKRSPTSTTNASPSGWSTPAARAIVDPSGATFHRMHSSSATISAGLIVLCWFHARRNAVPTLPPASWAEVRQAVSAGKWALLSPVFVLGGIYGGVFTPTEAAAMSCVYALVVGFLFERKLTLRGLPELFLRSARTSAMVTAIIAVSAGFGVLVAQFRRFVPSLVVLSAAPLSLVGAFGLLILTGTPLNVSSMMGLILLIGLIVKNGIILVDYAQIVAARGVAPVDALIEAGTVRLRPILMTTLCTLFGLLPLALGLGPGAEMQKPLAIAVIGGLSVSTIITLIFVPTVLAIRGASRMARSV